MTIPKSRFRVPLIVTRVIGMFPEQPWQISGAVLGVNPTWFSWYVIRSRIIVVAAPVKQPEPSRNVPALSASVAPYRAPSRAACVIMLVLMNAHPASAMAVRRTTIISTTIAVSANAWPAFHDVDVRSLWVRRRVVTIRDYTMTPAGLDNPTLAKTSAHTADSSALGDGFFDADCVGCVAGRLVRADEMDH